jgi:hypothetical protein
MNAEEGEKARELGKQPYVLGDPKELDGMPPFPFPMMGDAVDDVELEHLETLFCDSSGFGQDGERALSINQLVSKLEELFEEHGPLALAISEAGQFQLYLEVWKAGEGT